MIEPPVVEPPDIPSISYNNETLTIGNSITATPTSSGGTVTSWSISPPLPTGLGFYTSTGIISRYRNHPTYLPHTSA